MTAQRASTQFRLKPNSLRELRPAQPLGTSEIRIKELLIFLCLQLLITQGSHEIIYGTIDYVEVRELIKNENEIDWYRKSKSVAVIVPKDRFKQVSEHEYEINNFTLKEEIESLNEQHQFKDQISVGVGTAFLVSSNSLLTAGHLAKDLKDCVILFDYEWNSELNKLEKTRYDIDEIFYLAKVIKKKNSKRGDFALIEIDKHILDRDCLELMNFSNDVTKIKMISCPDGTPLKLTYHGRVLEKDPELYNLSGKGFFLHNLDNSGGSSGAPIYDSMTGKVIGIQAGGDDNYFEKNGSIFQVRGGENGENSNLGRNLSGEFGSRIPVKLRHKMSEK